MEKALLMERDRKLADRLASTAPKRACVASPNPNSLESVDSLIVWSSWNDDSDVPVGLSVPVTHWPPIKSWRSDEYALPGRALLPPVRMTVLLAALATPPRSRSEEHTSELQSLRHLV